MGKLFAGLEEDLGTSVEPEIVEGEPVAPEDIITAEEEAEEVAALASDTAATVDKIDEATDVEKQLEENIEQIDAQLEKPEEVTEVAAVVATEALNNIMRTLGYKNKKVTMITAHESVKHPLDSLSVAREGNTTVLEAIVTKIKELFDRCVMNIKSLFAKVSASLASSSKAGEALLAELQKIDFADGVAFDEKQVKAIVGRLALVGVIGKGKISSAPVAEFKSFLEILTSEKDSAGFDKLFTQISTLAKVEEVETPLATAMADFLKFVETPGQKAIAENAAAFGGKKLPEGYIFRVDGSSVKCLVKGESSFTVVTTPVAPEYLEKITVEFPKKEAVVAVIKEALAATKEISGFSKAYTDAVKKVEANIAAAIKKENGFTNKVVKSAVLQNSKVFAGQFCVDRILGLITGIRAVMAYGSIVKSAAGAKK